MVNTHTYLPRPRPQCLRASIISTFEVEAIWSCGGAKRRGNLFGFVWICYIKYTCFSVYMDKVPDVCASHVQSYQTNESQRIVRPYMCSIFHFVALFLPSFSHKSIYQPANLQMTGVHFLLCIYIHQVLYNIYIHTCVHEAISESQLMTDCFQPSSISFPNFHSKEIYEKKKHFFFCILFQINFKFFREV